VSFSTRGLRRTCPKQYHENAMAKIWIELADWSPLVDQLEDRTLKKKVA
jgi:hypothetical protein